MDLQKSIGKVFVELSELLDQLSCQEYDYLNQVILNASIGQHVRHILELFIELEKGYTAGTVNYDQRRRDKRIETDRLFAKKILWEIWSGLEKPDKTLVLAQGVTENANLGDMIQTNYFRELVYNLEHAVHHMALIRIGISSGSAVRLPDSFGVASSTIKYRATCAQ